MPHQPGHGADETGAVDDALASFERASDVYPPFAMSLYDKAWLLEQVGRDAEAAEAWEAYLETVGNAEQEATSVCTAREHLSRLRCL